MENSEATLKFSEAENKVRKKWLFFSTILPAILLISILIFYTVKEFDSLDFKASFEIFFVFLVFVGGLYLNYYCAYKKPGTILLLLIMVLASLTMVEVLLDSGGLVSKSLDIMFGSLIIYYSYKLRKINKNIRERRLLASPVYVNALSVFSTATNVEELNEQFTKLKTSQALEGAAEVAKAYYKQKKILKLANHCSK